MAIPDRSGSEIEAGRIGEAGFQPVHARIVVHQVVVAAHQLTTEHEFLGREKLHVLREVVIQRHGKLRHVARRREVLRVRQPRGIVEVGAGHAEAKRLRNPRPECYVTLDGLPLAFGQFQWPFHRSQSGSDTYIVHGEIHLADGGAHNLHAKVAASVTVTFAEIVPAMEQPYAETFVYNAIRKTVDLGQLEFVKSGNRQPVPVTTRYYSRWQKKFLFTETNDEERLEYLLRKVYWLSGVLGESKPVWIADPSDAQYLNTTEADLLRMASDEAGEGLMVLEGEFAAATPALMARAAEYQAKLEEALNFTKPQFNESMRSGHANM